MVVDDLDPDAPRKASRRLPGGRRRSSNVVADRIQSSLRRAIFTRAAGSIARAAFVSFRSAMSLVRPSPNFTHQ